MAVSMVGRGCMPDTGEHADRVPPAGLRGHRMDARARAAQDLALVEPSSLQ
ncbi:Hypothetical predicted protein, partial [Pelobates cultripes]